jgi:AbrB family looped-hinge helix DNA binding protein
MATLGKVTSKGQITVPVEVRRALGVDAGDYLVFEVRAGYAELKRAPSAKEWREEVKRTRSLPPRRHATDGDAVAAYFRDKPADDESGVLLVLGTPQDSEVEK